MKLPRSKKPGGRERTGSGIGCGVHIRAMYGRQAYVDRDGPPHAAKIFASGVKEPRVPSGNGRAPVKFRVCPSCLDNSPTWHVRFFSNVETWGPPELRGQKWTRSSKFLGIPVSSEVRGPNDEPRYLRLTVRRTSLRETGANLLH